MILSRKFPDWRSRWACILSIEKMAQECNALETYLHTLTFADPEPSEKEASKRFHSFAVHYLNRYGKKVVWAMQRGTRTGRLHYHLVSCDRWDAKEMWEVIARYGFGRYDVRPPKPVCKAAYVARYVSKATNGLASNVKSWGVIGFKRVKKMEVIRGNICLPRVTECPLWLLRHMPRLKLDESFARRKKFIESRFSEVLDVKSNMQNEVKSHQSAEVVKMVQDGSFSLVVGEYRGFNLKAGKKADRLSGVERGWTTVEHIVIAGTNRVVVSEFVGGDATKESIKPAAEIGELVTVQCTKAEWLANKNELQVKGYIRALVGLPLPITGGAAAPVKK